MWLKKIELNRWREDAPLAGNIEFEGENGSMGIKLDENQVAELVKAMAGVLVAQAQQTAKRLEHDAINTGRVLIEAPKSE